MNLPISAHYNRIIETVVDNPVTIIVGETGSGKTTQLPQMLYRSGLFGSGMIGITEPRRIAATSVAHFVAEELGSPIGQLVGYQVRYDRVDDRRTAIKFMTDGILLRRMQSDPDLKSYSVIMIDEAHERSANIDLLLGLLKRLRSRRPDLRLVIASATIDADKFSRYFDGAPVIEVDGRAHPVEIIWDQMDYSEERVLQRASDVVSDFIRGTTAGDALVFLTGVEQINWLSSSLTERWSSNVMVLPAHGSLPPQELEKVFQSFPGCRKVVLATNVAETSITIDGITCVVDTGLIKQTSFNPHSGIESLDTILHSQSGCNQRAGRAGRTQPGVCYRLYTKENFDRRPRFTEPEIKRMSLASVVLTMEDLDIPEIENFDFIDAPNLAVFHEAYQTLIALGAIHADKSGLTDIGREMARLPLEPRVARMVLEAQNHGCVEEIVTVAAFMSAGNVLVRPKGKEMDADLAHAGFKTASSDPMMYLKIWKQYDENGLSKRWCIENFLNSRKMWEVHQIREQLLDIMYHSGVDLTSNSDPKVVERCVCSGLVYNLIEHVSRAEYAGVARTMHSVYIHPGSVLFFKGGRWLVAAEVVNTTRNFARMCCPVDPAWLVDLMPSCYGLGHIRLTEYKEGENTVNAVRDIMDLRHRDQVITTVPTTVSLETARRIQSETAKEAELNGWILVQVASIDIFNVVSSDGRVYARSWNNHIKMQPGRSYYCSLLPTMFKEASLTAEAVFVPLPPEENSDGRLTVSEDSLALLSQKWGATVKRNK